MQFTKAEKQLLVVGLFRYACNLADRYKMCKKDDRLLPEHAQHMERQGEAVLALADKIKANMMRDD